MEEEKIKLSAILDAFLDFRANNGDVELYKKAEDLLQKVIVKEKMFLIEKQEALLGIMAFIGQGEPDAVTFALRREVGELFFGLFSYGVNLDMDISPDNMVPFIYDTFMTFGIADYFKKFCGTDFNELRRLVSEAVNFSNLERLVEATKMFTPEAAAETRKAIKEMKDYLTPEKIKDLKAILAAGEPAWQALKETVAETAVENATLQHAVDMGGDEPEKKAEEPKGEPSHGE